MTASKTNDLISFGAAGAVATSLADGDTLSIATLTNDSSTHSTILDAEVILLANSSSFANVGAAVDALESSGSYSITHQSNVSADDTFLFSYLNSTTNVVHMAAASFIAADDNSGSAAVIADGNLRGVDLASLTGVTDVTNFHVDNFDIIA